MYKAVALVPESSLLEGADAATEVKYDMIIRSNKQIDLGDIAVDAPISDPGDEWSFNSRLLSMHQCHMSVHPITA
jgi:hypothetical protein